MPTSKQIQEQINTTVSNVHKVRSSVSLANNTLRTPNVIHDVEVIISFSFVATALQNALVIIEVDDSGGGTFQTIISLGNAVSAIISNRASATFIVPMGSQYRYVTSGTGMVTVVAHFELLK